MKYLFALMLTLATFAACWRQPVARPQRVLWPATTNGVELRATIYEKRW